MSLRVYSFLFIYWLDYSSLDNSINPLTTTKPTVNSNSFVSSNSTTNSSSTPSQQPISSSNQTSLYQRTPLAERSRPNQFDNLAVYFDLFRFIL